MMIEVKDKHWCTIGSTNGYILIGNKIQKWIQLCLITQNIAKIYKSSARLIENNKVLYKYTYEK